MERKILIRFTTLLVSLVIIGSPVVDVYSCGWGSYEEEHPFVYFPLETLTPEGFTAFDFRYTISSSGGRESKSNIEEWGDYFSKQPTIALHRDIESIIFKSQIDQLTALRDDVRKKKELRAEFKINAVAQFWKEHPNDASLDYVVFAKRCEPHATQIIDEWRRDEEGRDTAAMKQLLIEGLQLHKKCKSEVMRLRYAYQIVRLAHYAGIFRESVDYYNELVVKNKTQSVIRYYAMNQKTGAVIGLLRKGLITGDQDTKLARAEVIRDLGRVYLNCKSCKLLSHEFLSTFQAENFLQAAEAAKTAEDKIGIWMMSAIREIPVHIALEKIYEISPNAPEAEVLLARLLHNKQQEYSQKAINCRNIEQKEFETSKEQDAELNQSIVLLEKIAAKENTSHPAAWNLGAGYLYSIRNDCNKTEHYYNKCASQLKPGEANIKTALDYLTLVLNLSKLDSTSNQSFVVALLDSVMHSNSQVKEYGLMRLSNFFESNKMEQEGWLTVRIQNFGGDYYRFNKIFEHSLDLNTIDELLAGFKKENKTALEAALWRYSRLTELDLLSYKATLLFHAHRFKESLAILNKLHPYIEANRILYGNPFLIHIKDCHDCDHQQYITKYGDGNYSNARRDGWYFRNKFIKNMAELEDSMQLPGEMQAYYHFRYANGLYNITHYGNARLALDLDLCPEGDVPDYDEYYWDRPIPNNLDNEGALREEYYPSDMAPRFYYDTREAMQYYLKAAELSNDREFKAKCIFMAAKCEQNEFYNRGGYDADDDIRKPAKNNWYRTQFRKLKSDYADTEFAKEAIQECSFFKYFMENDIPVTSEEE